MKKENELLLGYNLQLFADDGEGDNDDNQNANNGDQNDDANLGNEPNDDGQNEDDKPKEKTFTQSQVNSMMTKEKKQGRNSILKELGINPSDEKAIENVKNLIASQKSEEQLRLEKESEAANAFKEMEKKVKLAEAKTEAMMSGIKPQYVDDAVTLAFSKLSDDDDFKSILEEFKTKYPMWFGEATDASRGTGSTVNTGKNQNNIKKGYGARLAAKKCQTITIRNLIGVN